MSTMITAYNSKLARINLTDRTIKVEELSLDLAKKFIGGRGLGTKILYDEGIATVDPLSPDNKMIIMTGALTGTAVPTSGRYMVITKSPLNNMIACSNSGGRWGAILKFCGWEGLILEGKASSPVRLNIQDDKIEILPADNLWGKGFNDTKEILKKEYPSSSVLAIGQGGETGSLMGCIMNDESRAAGRSGVGAVMGSKNLKAITVTSTNSSKDVFNKEALGVANKDSLAKIRANPVTSAGLPTYGTAVLVNLINGVGSLPTKNWQGSYDANADNYSGEYMTENRLVKNSFCYRCPIGCGRVVERNGKEIDGPEYEVLWAYGGNCGNDDIDSIIEANYLCNDLGLDAISAPCTIASAMELYQRGLITDADCEGIPLKWGSKEAIITWTKRMGLGETKLGKLMAQGSYRLCDYYGAPELSMSVKKQDMPAYDARGIQGIGITYATSNRGACHVRGYLISPEILGLPEQLDRSATENKALYTKIFQDLTAVIDSAGMCLFTSFALGADDYAGLLNAAIDADFTADSVLESGERIYNIERMFNKSAGMKAEDDCLPKRLLEEAIPDGPSKGELSKLAITLPEYYNIRGWVNAFPTEETLIRLGLQ